MFTSLNLCQQGENLSKVIKISSKNRSLCVKLTTRNEIMS
jgi:hypothetical protein